MFMFRYFFDKDMMRKSMLYSRSFLSRMSNRLVNGNKTVASVAEETKLGEEVKFFGTDSIQIHARWEKPNN